MLKKLKAMLAISLICSMPYLFVNAQESITVHGKKMSDFNDENDKNMLMIKQFMRDNFKHLFIGSYSKGAQEKLINSFCELSLSSPDYYVVYTRYDGEFSGCIIFHKISQRGVVIDKGGIVKKFRRKRLGLRLMEYAITLFKKMGIERASLLTAEGNIGVCKIAERCGFVSDEKRFYFPSPYKRFRWK